MRRLYSPGKGSVPYICVCGHGKQAAALPERSPADENLSDSKMKRNIRSIDKGRARYYNYFSQQKWGARDNCDLLINTSGKDIKQISEAVAEYLKKYLFD